MALNSVQYDLIHKVWRQRLYNGAKLIKIAPLQTLMELP